LLGTGLDRDLAGPYAAAVAEINAAQRPVLAIDVPSGLDADTGQPHGSAVRAAVTISFVGLKTGLFLGLAADFCGDIEFSDLGLEAGVFAAHTPVLKRVTERELRAALPQRRRTAHKGSHGRLLVMGGGPGMGGAIRLAAEAALRTGAGLVYVVTHPENVQTVMGGRPEIICRGLSAAQFDEFEQGVDAVVLGPGLGQSDWAARAWRHFAAMDAPMILDADGLNWLARRPIERNRWLLTPHPGEAARLLGSSTADVEADRRGAAEELAGRHRACVVLKGANSLVAIPGPQTETFVCTAGNPGMATAGMGDVLSGVLGGLLAQTSDIQLTAKAGVLLHARAGDAAAANGGERGLIASDLMPYLRAGANL
jgi:hydroxyethylthiazole kinase-like uncharacterized protein yjeF